MIDWRFTVVMDSYKMNTLEIPPIIFVVDEKRNILYGYNGMYKDVLLVYKLEQS